MSQLRVFASVAAGLLLSACAQSGAVQKTDLTDDSAAKPSRAARSAPAGAASVGIASYYSYPGRTANGERYDPKQLTAAHRTLPFGTKLQVTNVNSGRSVVVRVNDRGPFIRGRIVDLSVSAARALGMMSAGVVRVSVQ